MKADKFTIKRTYDQYKPQDFDFGDSNLNPKREIILDQMALIEKAVQALTNDIVLKKIKTPEEVEEVIQAAMGGETPTGSSLARTEALVQAGSTTQNIFDNIPKDLELEIGAFPGNVNILQKPPILDCEEVYKKWDFEGNQYQVYESVVEDAPCYEITTKDVDEITDDTSEDEPPIDPDEEDDSVDDCAQIELEFLKIILIILKIIRVLLTIIDMVISTIIMIIKIVCLAVGAWINPPNVGQITQLIVGMIISLIVMIIAKLLAMLWKLLNLDCLADQTLDILAQIQEAMNAFSSTIAMIDPGAITFMGDFLSGGLNDIASIIEELMKAKAEAWAEATEEIKNTFSKEGLTKMKDQILEETKNGILQELGNYGQLSSIARAGTLLKDSAVGIAKDTKKKFEDIVGASKAAYQAIIKGDTTKVQDEVLNKVLNDTSIRGLAME